MLVVTGLFLAAIMLDTGLEKRMALTILKIVGTKTRNLMAGMIVAMSVFGFFIPSITARSATLCPIALGLVDALKFSRKSQFSKALMLSIALSSSVSGVGVLSGAGAESGHALVRGESYRPLNHLAAVADLRRTAWHRADHPRLFLRHAGW